MALLNFAQRQHLPIWDDPRESIYHDVVIDTQACDGCKLCVVVCPGNALELVGEKGAKKSRVKDGQRGCISCNNCQAICSHHAIEARQYYDFAGYYKQMGLGEFSPPRRF
ncbi:MAG: 4Fe-4S dicluster domain-containing protein [Betaproteobacteria bacterium]|nr:4Fe-4S dicluster domain-containing protein [Betaproteobacteria bacterium]